MDIGQFLRIVQASETEAYDLLETLSTGEVHRRELDTVHGLLYRIPVAANQKPSITPEALLGALIGQTWDNSHEQYQALAVRLKEVPELSITLHPGVDYRDRNMVMLLKQEKPGNPLRAWDVMAKYNPTSGVWNWHELKDYPPGDECRTLTGYLSPAAIEA